MSAPISKTTITEETVYNQPAIDSQIEKAFQKKSDLDTSETRQIKELFRCIFSSAMGGSIAAGGFYPGESLKKKFQTGQMISLYPQKLWQGCTPYIVSVTSATVTSMTFRHYLEKIPGYDYSSPYHQAASAISGGMLGALFGSTPVENTILEQQMKNLGPIEAIKSLFKQGVFRPWVGLPELMMREAGFVGLMLWGSDAAEQKVTELTGKPSLGKITQLALGVGGAAATQPFDTIATYKQQHLGISSIDAIKRIYAQGGLLRFQAGLSGRVFLFTGCMLTIPTIEAKIRKTLSNVI
jgi:hypothetical protein